MMSTLPLQDRERIFPEKALRELYQKMLPADYTRGQYDAFMAEVAKQYNWTTGQAYIATEFLFRPKENYN